MSQRKKVTMTLIVSGDTNQNDFKNWVKSCPFSADGDQTVHWENIPDPVVEQPDAPAESA